MSHHRSSSSTRHHRRHPHPLAEPPPYILDFSAQTCRPRIVTSIEDIRTELATPNRPGWQRVLVLRSLDGDVVGKVGKDGWKWTFLDLQRTGPGGLVEEKVCSAELWVRGEVYILLLDGLPTWTLPCPRHPPHRRRASSSKPPRLGDVALNAPQKSMFEERLWEKLGDCRPLEEVVASVVYESWTGIVQSLGPGSQTNGERLWKYLQALEMNMDSSSQVSVGITPVHWTTLLNRLHQRIHLSLLLQTSTTPPPMGNTRSLNRIAYLGGLLLPLTVVSGILSIEGTYGPEGSAFWVFWLAAGLSSIVALLVIHADHLRTLDVWMEEEIFEGHARGEDVEAGGFGVLSAEEKSTKWRRRELGWVGAMKKMTGWYWWKGSPGMEWRMPDGWEERMNKRMGW